MGRIKRMAKNQLRNNGNAKNRRHFRRKLIRMGLLKSDFVTVARGKDWSHEAAFTAKGSGRG